MKKQLVGDRQCPHCDKFAKFSFNEDNDWIVCSACGWEWNACLKYAQKKKKGFRTGQKEQGPEEFSQGSPKQSPDMEDKGNTGSKEFKFVKNLKTKGPLCWTFMTFGGLIGYVLAKKQVFTGPASSGAVDTGGLAVVLSAALMALGYFVGSLSIKKINKLPNPKRDKTMLAWGTGILGLILSVLALGLIDIYIQKSDLKSVQPEKSLSVEDPSQKSNSQSRYDPLGVFTETDKKEWLRRGSDYIEAESYKEAAAAFGEAIKLDPNDPIAWCSLGLAYGHLNRYDDAIDADRQALRIDPEQAMAWNNLAIAYALSGNKTAALDAVRELRRLDPEKADKLFNLIVPR